MRSLSEVFSVCSLLFLLADEPTEHQAKSNFIFGSSPFAPALALDSVVEEEAAVAAPERIAVDEQPGVCICICVYACASVCVCVCARAQNK